MSHRAKESALAPLEKGLVHAMSDARRAPYRLWQAAVGLICGVIATGWIPRFENRVLDEMGGIASALVGLGGFLILDRCLFGPLADWAFPHRPIRRRVGYVLAALAAGAAFAAALYVMAAGWIGVVRSEAPQLEAFGIVAALGAVAFGLSSLRDRSSRALGLVAAILGMLVLSGELAAYVLRLV